jgi:hypothetical protein
MEVGHKELKRKVIITDIASHHSMTPYRHEIGQPIPHYRGTETVCLVDNSRIVMNVRHPPRNFPTPCKCGSMCEGCMCQIKQIFHQQAMLNRELQHNLHMTTNV